MLDNPITPIEGMDGTLIAQDGNLTVRLMTMRDFWKMVGWLSDERLLEFYEGRDTRWTESDVMLHFFGRPDHDAEFLRVVMLLDGEAIGYGQIYRLYGEMYDEYHYPDFGDVVYAMDQFIGDPELWDIGIGTRYVRMVVEWLAQKRKAAAVLVDPRKANKRAVRCYQKAGFEIKEDLPAHELHEGKFEDCYLMEYLVLEKDWEQIKEDHAAAYFAADMALENPEAYSLEEKRAIIERMQESTEEIDAMFRKEFQAMTPEARQVMLSLLEDSPEGREWWERILLNFDDLPDAPPES